MEVTPYDATLDAVVTDVKLGKKLDDATFASIETVWYERDIRIFPKQG